MSDDLEVDCYDILNLNPECTQKEVFKAFRRMAKKYHPDMEGGDSDLYELIKFYYRKRVQAYIELLQERIKEGLTVITTEERRDGMHRFLTREFDPVYDRLRDEWMRQPLQMPVKYRPTPLEAVTAVLKEF